MAGVFSELLGFVLAHRDCGCVATPMRSRRRAIVSGPPATSESNGWRHLSSTTAADKGTTQVYDKAGSSLQVLIYEGWYYT
jgi:hypothetical protein